MRVALISVEIESFYEFILAMKSIRKTFRHFNYFQANLFLLFKLNEDESVSFYGLLTFCQINFERRRQFIDLTILGQGVDEMSTLFFFFFLQNFFIEILIIFNFNFLFKNK